MSRIYLSPPHMGVRERELLLDSFDSNWIAPLGPHVDSFERELGEKIGGLYAAALTSGTAALHLALLLIGVGKGDQVLVSTFTFAATAYAVIYTGATPVFIDCEPGSWNMDPGLLAEEIEACARRRKLPRAVVVVDLYGQCANYDPILNTCAKYNIPVVEDAAEALGATYKGLPAGSFGKAGVFSFNGNKIITTSGGGMLVSRDENFIKRAKYLASQARDLAPHYQHSEIGYNYRMSNLLAAIGRGQLMRLEERVERRRRNFEFYRNVLGSLPGLEFMPEASYGRCTRWLTCLTIEPSVYGANREDVRLALEAENIESRPVWKPMHLQPVFSGCRVRGGGISEEIYEKGLCLPSGSDLTDADLTRIDNIIRRGCKTGPTN